MANTVGNIPTSPGAGTDGWLPSTNGNLNTFRASGMTGDQNIAITTTNISVYSNGMKVGFVQSASPSESRSITKIQALGVEGVVQTVPGNTNGGQISLSRFAVYNGTLFQALGITDNAQFTGNPFNTLKDQRVPIEIQVRTNLPNGGYLADIYLDCWLASYSKSIASSTITITEQATVQYSDVITNMDTN